MPATDGCTMTVAALEQLPVGNIYFLVFFIFSLSGGLGVSGGRCGEGRVTEFKGFAILRVT